MVRYLIPLGLFSVLALFLYVGLSLNPRDIGSTRVDKPAPTFTLPQVADTTQIMSDQTFLGKVSIFNAWASWCVSCRYEHPLLMQLAQNSNIPIYGLNYKDKLEDARAMLARDGNPYTANAFDETGKVGMDWGIIGTPETFIIDKKGIVRYKHTGPLTVDVLKETILPLIKELDAA